jgi:hypothetical protein
MTASVAPVAAQLVLAWLWQAGQHVRRVLQSRLAGHWDHLRATFTGMSACVMTIVFLRSTELRPTPAFSPADFASLYRSDVYSRLSSYFKVER